jgi:hypothetical protein
VQSSYAVSAINPIESYRLDFSLERDLHLVVAFAVGLALCNASVIAVEILTVPRIG